MKRILKRIAKEFSQIKDVKLVILYGSLARGEFTSRSDIDLFILTEGTKAQRELQEKVIELESKIGRNIQPTIRTAKGLKRTDVGLLQNIFQEGKTLYLKEPLDIPSTLLLEQKPYLIYTFQINNLSQKDKAKFNRKFYGEIKKGYKYEGLLHKLGGQKLSSGCVIAPFKQKENIEKFFKKFKVKFERLNVWK
jgi:predicted nucleotidyltransferase